VGVAIKKGIIRGEKTKTRKEAKCLKKEGGRYKAFRCEGAKGDE